MIDVIDAYKQVKIEKEAQFHFLQLLVNQLHVGMIAIEDDDIILINPTAEKLLGINGLKTGSLFVSQILPSQIRYKTWAIMAESLWKSEWILKPGSFR